MAKIIAFISLILLINTGVRFNVITTSRESQIRMALDSLARSEFEKNIVEITPNWHPEIEKYFISAGVSPKSAYAWCGYFKHWLNLSVGIPGKGGWAASWISDKRAIKKVPVPSDGFAIRRNGGSGWHVGHISRIMKQEGYFVTYEGNINNRLTSGKIFLDFPGIVYFSYINL